MHNIKYMDPQNKSTCNVSNKALTSVTFKKTEPINNIKQKLSQLVPKEIPLSSFTFLGITIKVSSYFSSTIYISILTVHGYTQNVNHTQW